MRTNYSLTAQIQIKCAKAVACGEREAADANTLGSWNTRRRSSNVGGLSINDLVRATRMSALRRRMCPMMRSASIQAKESGCSKVRHRDPLLELGGLDDLLTLEDMLSQLRGLPDGLVLRIYEGKDKESRCAPLLGASLLS